jgi:heat shock protein HtpX
MNTMKTALLMVGLTVLLVLVGGSLFGNQGMVWFFAIAMAMNFITYWFSDKIVLRMYNAQEVTLEKAQGDARVLYGVTRDLAARGNLPMPKVYVIPSGGLNAFATGRNPSHAAVAATEGLIRSLSHEELAGVMAHELSHVQNRDILIGTIAAAIAGAISMIANIAQWGMIFGGYGGRRDDDRGGGIAAIAMIILAPIAALLIQMAISRSREYQADASGARLCGNPRALANALRKLQMASGRAPIDANPATAHMFIVNPLRGGGITKWFSTHPPMEERISRLESMRL